MYREKHLIWRGRSRPEQKGAQLARFFSFFFLHQARKRLAGSPLSQTPLSFFLSNSLSVPTLPVFFVLLESYPLPFAIVFLNYFSRVPVKRSEELGIF